MFRPADGVATPPEFRSYSGVGAIAQQATQLAVLDLPANLGAELEIVPPVVYRPRPVGFQVDTVVRVSDQIAQRPRPGLQANVGHAYQRNSIPRRCAHTAVGNQTQPRRRLARHQIPDEFAGPDDVGSLSRQSLVIPTEGTQTRRARAVGGDVHQLRPVRIVVQQVRRQE